MMNHKLVLLLKIVVSRQFVFCYLVTTLLLLHCLLIKPAYTEKKSLFTPHKELIKPFSLFATVTTSAVQSMLKSNAEKNVTAAGMPHVCQNRNSGGLNIYLNVCNTSHGSSEGQTSCHRNLLHRKLKEGKKSV